MDNYDEIANDYDKYEEQAVTLWQLGYPVVNSLLGNVKGKAILDYGCGTGNFSRYLQAKGAMVTGLDVAENMINVAKRNGPESITYHTLAEGGFDLLTDESFDFVVSNFVLCTIPSREEIVKILDQIHRVLKKEGKFVFMNSDWDKSNGKEFLSFKLEFCKDLIPGHPITAIIKSDPPIPLHDFFWSIEDYTSMLHTARLRVFDLKEKLAGQPLTSTLPPNQPLPLPPPLPGRGSSDDIQWLDERKFPPYYVIEAGC
jgi:SAM-dependent methyltransferase